MAHPDSASLPRDLRYGERREREYTRLIDSLGEVSSPSKDVQCGCHPGLSRPYSGVRAYGSPENPEGRYVLCFRDTLDMRIVFLDMAQHIDRIDHIERIDPISSISSVSWAISRITICIFRITIW